MESVKWSAHAGAKRKRVVGGSLGPGGITRTSIGSIMVIRFGLFGFCKI
jgi:hypothetical protein